MRAALFVCLVALVAATASGQEAKREFTNSAAEDFGSPTFAVDVPLVNVGFSVRDRGGRLIRDLTPEDFEVFEDGEAQKIHHFASERESPLSVGVLIDFSPSQNGFEDENIYVAMSFFKRILRPQDSAFLVAFGNNIRLIQAPTNSIDDLDHGLRNVEGIYRDAPRVGPKKKRKGGSAVVDAIYWTAEERFSKVGGRKAIIMIGDGKENSSKKQLYDAIEKLQSLDVIFYGLDNGGSQSRANRRLRNRMPMIAEESGGREFRIGETSLRAAFDQIEAELRALYTLGYISSHPESDGRFRKIEIRPHNKLHLVHARPGYYAQ